MIQFQLKNGKNVQIREATQEDAQQMINFYNVVGGETDFLSFGENEFKRDVQEYRDYLETTRMEQNSIIYIALLDEEISSIATINSSQKARTKHVGTLGIVVSERYIGQGLGKKMMELLIEWAASNGVTGKISLITREDNSFAIALYEKLGFEKEGLLLEDNIVDGVAYNSLVMGLFVY